MSIFELESQEIERSIAIKIVIIAAFLLFILQVISVGIFGRMFTIAELPIGSELLNFALFSVFPLLAYFVFRKTLLSYRVIVIEGKRVVLKNRLSNKEDVELPALSKVLVHRTPPLNFRADLVGAHYWTKLIITLVDESGFRKHLLTRGEVLKNLIDKNPDIQVEHTGFKNLFVFLIPIVGCVTIIDFIFLFKSLLILLLLVLS